MSSQTSASSAADETSALEVLRLHLLRVEARLSVVTENQSFLERLLLQQNSQPTGEAMARKRRLVLAMAASFAPILLGLASVSRWLC